MRESVMTAIAAGRPALICALLLGACASGSKHGVPQTKGCNSDADCSATRHEVCRAAAGSSTANSSTGGTCVIPASPSKRQVYFEILPVTAAAALPVQIGPINLGDGQNQQLAVPLPVQASGSVVDESTGQPIALATVQFVSNPVIPSRPQVFQTTTADGSSGPVGQFTQTLPQGSYTVTVQPPNSGGIVVPPQQFRNVVVDASGAIAPFQVTSPSQVITVAGIVSSALIGQPQPVVGVSVTATDASPTGTPLSQTVQTDITGEFQLGLVPPPSGANLYPVRLQIGPGTNGVPFPSFSSVVEFDLQDTPGRRLSFPVNLQLPGSMVTVNGTVLDPNGNPISGMRVLFHSIPGSRTGSGVFTFSASTTSASDGSFEVHLVPADYTAIALPPADALASQPTDDNGSPSPYDNVGLCGLTPNGTGTLVHVSPALTMPVVLACEVRQQAFGQVETQNDGTPVAGVVVDGYREASPDLPNGLHFQTVSHGDGVFTLPLVSGTYDVSLAPPSSSQLPIKWASGAFQVSPSLTQYTEVFLLDQPFQLFGKLVASGTANPVEAIIDAYGTDSDSTVALGHGRAGTDGQYSIVLPTGAPGEGPSSATPVVRP